MSNFDIKRFGKTLLWSAKMTRKEMLTNFAVMFFAFTVPFIIYLLSRYNGTGAHTVASLMTTMRVDMGIYFIIAITGGCWLFNNMKTKEQRIMFKMLPATDLEKFLVRALYVTVVWWIMAYVAFCLADVFRMLISLIAGIDVIRCLIPEFYSMLIGPSDYYSYIFIGMSPAEAYAMMTSPVAYIFWVHSLYILGGALLRRRQFVLTTLVLFVLGIATVPILRYLAEGAFHEITRELAIPLIWTGAAVFTAWGIADWILSYKIFHRMQVINNKWLNL
jgi:hypothetical protein